VALQVPPHQLRSPLNGPSVFGVLDDDLLRRPGFALRRVLCGREDAPVQVRLLAPLKQRAGT
jgi:hypothetical protein